MHFESGRRGRIQVNSFLSSASFPPNRPAAAWKQDEDAITMVCNGPAATRGQQRAAGGFGRAAVSAMLAETVEKHCVESEG